MLTCMFRSSIVPKVFSHSMNQPCQSNLLLYLFNYMFFYSKDILKDFCALEN